MFSLPIFPAELQPCLQGAPLCCPEPCGARMSPRCSLTHMPHTGPQGARARAPQRVFWGARGTPRGGAAAQVWLQALTTEGGLEFTSSGVATRRGPFPPQPVWSPSRACAGQPRQFRLSSALVRRCCSVTGTPAAGGRVRARRLGLSGWPPRGEPLAHVRPGNVGCF